MTRGRIVLVAFPFDDLSATKVRPALCLTEPIGPHRHVIVAFITSQVTAEPLASDLVLDAGDEDFHLTGLKVSSAVRLHRLTTLAEGIFQRNLGELSASTRRDVDRRLTELFGLADTDAPGETTPATLPHP